MAQLTISQIVKESAILIGLEEPAGTIVGSTDRDIKKLLLYAIETGRELRNLYYFPQLKRLHTFQTVSGQNQYKLPGDFWSMIPSTQWDQTNSWRMFGPLNSEEWNTFQYGVVSSITRKRFRVSGSDIDGGQYFVEPTPQTTDTLSFEYITSQWFHPEAWNEGFPVNLGDFRSASGNIYLAATSGTMGATRPTHTSGGVSDGSIVWVYVPSQIYGNNQRFQKDNDIPLIDDDLIIMGTVFRYLRKQGMDYSLEGEQYRRAARKRLTRLESAPTINMGQTGLSRFLSYDNIPEGGY